jgi:hypothetical protein
MVDLARISPIDRDADHSSASARVSLTPSLASEQACLRQPCTFLALIDLPHLSLELVSVGRQHQSWIF